MIFYIFRGGNVTSAGWQVTLCDSMTHEFPYRCGNLANCYKLVTYLLYFTKFGLIVQRQSQTKTRGFSVKVSSPFCHPNNNLDFTEARDSERQWHQLGHMQVCTSLQTDNHASTPPLCIYRPDALPATQPTASKH